MSPPQEHDYIGLSAAAPSVAPVEDGGRPPPALNLKETELRLGPPGSASPDRKDSGGTVGLTLDLLPTKANLVSGAKRGFSDAIDGNWVFSGVNGSEVELGKGGALFSPRAEAAAGGVGQHSGPAGTAAKDVSVLPKTAAGQDKKAQSPPAGADRGVAPAAKAQVVGWPPIRSYRKNTMATNPVKNKEDGEGKQGVGPCLYIKVSMDGAPYLRKVDLKTHCNYKELSSALEKMFSGFTFGQCGGQGLPGRDGLNESRLTDLLNGSEYVLTYEDKDGDWMLVGDVPWQMFTNSCRRLRIMKGSDAIGLAPRAMEKCKNRT